MLFLKLLGVCLLVRAVWGQQIWSAYVDEAAMRAVEGTKINMLQVLREIRAQKVSCVSVRVTETPGEEGSGAEDPRRVIPILQPCGTIHADVSFPEPVQWTWLLVSPPECWIELKVQTFHFPLGGAQCSYGYVELRNLLSTPHDVKLCGKRPEQTLFAASTLAISPHILQLISRVELSFHYYFISKKKVSYGPLVSRAIAINSGEYCCFMEGDCLEDERCYLPVRDLPYHTLSWQSGVSTFTVQLSAMFDSDRTHMLLVSGSSCEYIVYDGPGKLSPVTMNSSQATDGVARLLFRTQIYIEMWGRDGCETMNMSYWGGLLREFESLPGNFHRPPVCNMVETTLSNSELEYRISSSRGSNTWCLLYKASITNYLFSLEFHGPQVLIQQAGQLTCQYGGVHVYATSILSTRSFSVCESRADVHVSNHRSMVVAFAAGYSYGFVVARAKLDKLDNHVSRITTTPMCPAHVLACQYTYTKSIWEFMSVMVHDGKVSTSDFTDVSFVSYLQRNHAFRIAHHEPVIEAVSLHIRAGNDDGSVSLGLVHFVLNLRCSALSFCHTSYLSRMYDPITRHLRTHIQSYNGSLNIDKHLTNIKHIEVRLTVSPVPEFYAYVFFSQVLQCNANAIEEGSGVAKLLRYSDCDVIRLSYAIKQAHFFVQPLQTLRISLEPACPVKHCIDMVVQVTFMVTWDTLISYEWRGTDLAHVSIALARSEHVAIWWSSHCPDSMLETASSSRDRCGVVVDVSINAQLAKYMQHVASHPAAHPTGKPLLARVSPRIEQLYFLDTAQLTWRGAQEFCEQRGAHLPHWKTPSHMLNQSTLTDLLISSNSPDKISNLVFLGMLVKNASYRWTDGTPLVNYDYWNVPDVVNAYPRVLRNDYDLWLGMAKTPNISHVRSAARRLQPRSDADDEQCVASLRPDVSPRSWFQVPCDVPFKVMVTCERSVRSEKSERSERSERSESPASGQEDQHTHVQYCIGQTFISSAWCLVHVISLEPWPELENASCVSSSPGLRGLGNVMGVYGAGSGSNATVEGQGSTVAAYQRHMCEILSVMCNITTGVAMIRSITDWVCIVPVEKAVCTTGTFQCLDLSCIPSSKVCDNIADCFYGEDEESCGHCNRAETLDCSKDCVWPGCLCDPAYFQCDAGGCVPGGSVCDFEENCGDGSDEAYCGELLCPEGWLPCRDGRACYPQKGAFDGVEDCADASDELLPSPDQCPGFRCTDGKCIPTQWLNDGISDCPWDEEAPDEDEEDFVFQRSIGQSTWPCGGGTLPCRGSLRRCYPRHEHCVYDTDSQGRLYTCRNAGHLADCGEFPCENMFKCPRSYCIGFHRVCDGVADCQDRADEALCPMLSCPGMLHCPRENLCVHLQDVCDGTPQCRESLDDEKYCLDNVLAQCVDCATLCMSLVSEQTHLRLLQLQDQNIVSLERNALTHQTSLVVFNVANNHIHTVPEFAFSGCPYVRFIFLTNNSISVLFPASFLDLHVLRILDLAHNEITYFPAAMFLGIHTLGVLRLSYNPIMSVLEELFLPLEQLGSVLCYTPEICCMVQDDVTCELEIGVQPVVCADLLLHPGFSYTIPLLSLAMLLCCAAACFRLVHNKMNVLMLSLYISESLYGVYLAVISVSDLRYRGRFPSFMRVWPTSYSCYAAMLAFLISLQQSLISLVFFSCHTCILTVFPFKRGVAKRVNVYAVWGWVLPLVQVAVVVTLQYTENLVVVESSHALCQSPHLVSPSLRSAVLAGSSLVFLVLLGAFCAFTVATIVVLRRAISFNNVAKNTRLKRRLLWKCVVSLGTNSLSLTTGFTMQGLLLSATQLNDVALLVLTMSLMALNKITNPWIFTITSWLNERNHKSNAKQ